MALWHLFATLNLELQQFRWNSRLVSSQRRQAPTVYFQRHTPAITTLRPTLAVTSLFYFSQLPNHTQRPNLRSSGHVTVQFCHHDFQHGFSQYPFLTSDWVLSKLYDLSCPPCGSLIFEDLGTLLRDFGLVIRRHQVSQDGSWGPRLTLFFTILSVLQIA